MVLAGALAAVAGAGVAWWRWTPKASSSQELEAFWSQRFAQPAGGELDLQSFRGKPLLVNFWATWCPPCVEELPMIDAFSREHAAKGLQVLALAIDQPSAVRRFLERQALSFPVGLAGLLRAELRADVPRGCRGVGLLDTPLRLYWGGDAGDLAHEIMHVALESIGIPPVHHPDKLVQLASSAIDLPHAAMREVAAP